MVCITANQHSPRSIHSSAIAVSASEFSLFTPLLGKSFNCYVTYFIDISGLKKHSNRWNWRTVGCHSHFPHVWCLVIFRAAKYSFFPTTFEQHVSSCCLFCHWHRHALLQAHKDISHNSNFLCYIEMCHTTCALWDWTMTQVVTPALNYQSELPLSEKFLFLLHRQLSCSWGSCWTTSI